MKHRTLRLEGPLHVTENTSSGEPVSGFCGRGISRRGILRRTLSLAVLGTVGASFDLHRPGTFARTDLSSAQALEELLAGNRRFVEGNMRHCAEDLDILRQHTAEKQEPFAAVLSCADSRVPVELIFDQSIGHIFVTRVAGNVATAEMIASLEYGAAVLGTKVILVLGHSNCGAVKAAMAGKDVPGQISSLYLPLRPSIDEAGTNSAAAAQANARIQARLLGKCSTVISGLMVANKISVAAAYYDVSTGIVSMLA